MFSTNLISELRKSVGGSTGCVYQLLISNIIHFTEVLDRD